MSNLLQIKDNETDEYITIRISQYDIVYSKIWGSSIKNMEGSTRATLIGITAIIKATTQPLLQAEVTKVGNLLNQGSMSARFFDSQSGTTQTEDYIASDIDINMIRENHKWYEEIGFTLTPIDIRGVIS